MPYRDPEKRRESARKYYLKNRDTIRARVKRNDKQRYQEYVTEVKPYLEQVKSVPCMDCGQSYPPYVMDFDHVRGEKLFNVGSYRQGFQCLEKIQAEVDKCEVVCSNCHRIRTHLRASGSI